MSKNKKFKQPKPKTTLKAIDKLIAFYKRYPMTVIPSSYGAVHDGCPLCAINRVRKQLAPDCGKCPWFTIESKYCDGTFRQSNTATRIKRLRRWKKKIIGGMK